MTKIMLTAAAALLIFSSVAKACDVNDKDYPACTVSGWREFQAAKTSKNSPAHANMDQFWESKDAFVAPGTSLGSMDLNIRRINCFRNHPESVDPIEECDIPEKAVLYAMYILATHFAESQWAQDHCVPRIPRGYRCDDRGYWVIK